MLASISLFILQYLTIGVLINIVVVAFVGINKHKLTLKQNFAVILFWPILILMFLYAVFISDKFLKRD